MYMCVKTFCLQVAIFEDKMNTKNILVYSKTNPDTPFPLSKILVSTVALLSHMNQTLLK